MVTVEPCYFCGRKPRAYATRRGCDCGLLGPERKTAGAALRAWNDLNRRARLGRKWERSRRI